MLGPPRHPSQLYEAVLEGMVLVCILAWMFWKTQARYQPGKLVGAFLFFYGLFRFGMEFIREPDSQLVAFTRATAPAHGPVAVAADDPAWPLFHADREQAAGPRRADCGHGECRLTPFERALRERIRAKGPISVEAIWKPATLIITRPATRSGRRATSRPHRKSARCSANWSERRSPTAGVAPDRRADADLRRTWPGRGTLAADALRVMRSAGFAGEVHFVETSPMLREAQARPCRALNGTIASSELRAVPLLLVANEFLDALPIRQHVGGIERARMVSRGGARLRPRWRRLWRLRRRAIEPRAQCRGHSSRTGERH